MCRKLLVTDFESRAWKADVSLSSLAEAQVCGGASLRTYSPFSQGSCSRYRKVQSSSMTCSMTSSLRRANFWSGCVHGCRAAKWSGTSGLLPRLTSFFAWHPSQLLKAKSSYGSQEEAYMSSEIREGEIDIDVRYISSPPLCSTTILH